MGETSKQSTSSFVFGDNSFDVLRIFSALLIVLGHIIGHLNCNVWKPLYLLWIHWPGLLCLFTLTGYLIPASLERSKSKKEFLVKRISRIYPELWVAFAVSLVAVLAMGGYGNLHYSVKDIVVWTISQVTVFQFYTPSSIEIYGVGNPNGALWTISMELQVYVVIMLVYPWLKKQKKSVWWGIGLISLLFNILYPFSEAFIPTIVYKLINVTFLPYAYIYWIGIYAYTFKDKLIPKLKKYFWYLLGGYMIWCVLNDTVLHLSYDFYGIYAKFHKAEYEILERNIGIFWEPGMYQGYVIFASILVAVRKEISWKTIIYQILMVVCIFSMKSTTGYLLLIPVFLIYALKSAEGFNKKVQFLMTAVIIGITVIIFFNNDILYGIIEFISPDIIPKISNTSNESTATRLYSTLIDMNLVVRHPFGINILEIDSMRAQMAGILRYMVDGSNINTTFTMMLYYGVIPGLLYLFLQIKACFMMSDNRFISAVILVITLIIINTEPHYMTLLFTTFFMYFARKIEKNEYNEMQSEG